MFPIRDNIPARTIPVATFGLMAVTVAVFVYQTRLSSVASAAFLYDYGAVPARFTHPNLAAAMGFSRWSGLSLLTSVFLHGGWFHLISNMWALWLFGDNVEDRFGRLRYTIFYLVCGIIAMGVHVVVNPQSPVPAVGASGAIAGVMGAYLILFPKARMLVFAPIFVIPYFSEIPAVLFLLAWIAIQVVSGLAESHAAVHATQGVAFWAHVGGFFCGIVLGILLRSVARRSYGKR